MRRSCDLLEVETEGGDIVMKSVNLTENEGTTDLFIFFLDQCGGRQHLDSYEDYSHLV